MLKHLLIKNFTLIDKLDIDFKPGFSVITGETGAGKSIILGAIGLLKGNRADSRQIKAGEQKCIIEAHFDLTRYDMKAVFENNDIDYQPDDTIIRRELTASGKSRAFINDSPVPLSAMKAIGEQLIDIHSQHQNLLLQKQDFQLNVVDIIAKNNILLKNYRLAFNKYNDTRKQVENLKKKIEADRENEEFMRFQLNELSEAGLQGGQQEELEQKNEMLSHSEDIKSALYEADSLLNDDDNGVIGRIHSAAQKLQDIEGVFPEVKELAERLDSTYIEVKDIADEISSGMEHVDFDPNELEFVNSQLDTIYTLEKKYHVDTVEDLLKKQEELKTSIDNIDNGDEHLQELEKAATEAMKKAEELAAQLTEARKKAAEKVEEEIKTRLVSLGMPHVRFQVDIKEKPLAADGADCVCFMFSANTSTQLRPVSEIASGGEIARVMLSLKAMISGAVKLPTIIFDEIDTGVSGKIAERMARIMQEMGHQDRQVISITHLPQIAALGTTHYKVSKQETSSGTTSHMTMLNDEERVREIAQMLSGSDITEAALANAKALLASAGK